jgi:D-glycero-alpha-D-manno-heptose-7-phosphate kinase
MVIRARTPLRITFGGGGTDISPYPEERGGCTLSATISKYAYGTLALRDDDLINVQSLDYDIVASYGAGDIPAYDGKLDLVKATLKVMDIRQGMNVFLHTDAPPGSGLGSSSAMTVSLVGLFKHWGKITLSDYQIAELAWFIERKELGVSGGKQDQYAATFGGFNFIEYFKDATVVSPLKIHHDTLNELQYRLMLCFSGKRRPSVGIIDEQVSAYRQREKKVVRALDSTKALAISMKKALLLGRIDELGCLLHEAWLTKKNFSGSMSDPYLDEIYEIARANGAIGGKLLGAGGAGYFLFLCQFDKWHKVAEKVEKCGAKVTECNFDFHGLQTWEMDGAAGDSGQAIKNNALKRELLSPLMVTRSKIAYQDAKK